ncbi:hypothetical protein [Pseudaeromonas pectinilytica]
MKIKTKIVSLAAISLILVVVVMNLTNYFLGQAQLEEKQTLLEKQLLTEKKEILVKYLALAESSIAKIYLITIETQPASTGVVALEPFDSRS